MKLALTFIVETPRYPSTFDEFDMIETIANMMGVDEDTVEFDVDEVE